jgi:hypothetical protein
MRTERYVCADCFNDKAIKTFVHTKAIRSECDFCNSQSTSPHAAPWSCVLALIREGIESCWTDEPGCEVDFPGVPSYSTEQVLENANSPIKNESVLEALLLALHDQEPWYGRFFGGKGRFDKLVLEWDDFLYHVIQKSRFFFFVPKAGDDNLFEPPEMPTVDVLDALGDLVRATHLVRMLPAGERFFRARQHAANQHLETAAELGPPNHETAIYPNRMSPSGIVMFYGATEQLTALSETYDPSRTDNRNLQSQPLLPRMGSRSST